jgi:hypothetical protein
MIFTSLAAAVAADDCASCEGYDAAAVEMASEEPSSYRCLRRKSKP